MMDIEVRNLDIEWDASGRVLRVDKSPYAIEIIEHNDTYQVETVTYPKAFFYTGFRVLADHTLHVPYFSLKDKTEDLLRVDDPNSEEVWWIQNGKWDAKKKKYLPESYRTAGILELKIQDRLFWVHIHTNNFSIEDLEYFLSDFKNDLWSIILDVNSMVGANVEQEVPHILSDEVLGLLDRFINAAESILKEPKFYLKETQDMVSRAKVRPMPRTFRELVTKPDAKRLTSRVHQTSFDTPDNRYVHYCVDRLFLLLGKTNEVTSNLEKKLGERAQQYKQKMVELGKAVAQQKLVSKTLFDSELQELKDKRDQIYRDFNDLTVLNNTYEYLEGDECSHEMSLDKIYANGKHSSFFCSKIDGRVLKNDEKFKTRCDYLVVGYPKYIFAALQKYSEKGNIINVRGFAKKIYPEFNNHYNQHQKREGMIIWTGVHRIGLADSSPLLISINNREQRRQFYEKNEWQKPYTDQERQEIQQERESLKKRAIYFHSLSTKYQNINMKASARHKRLRELKQAFKNLGIGKSAHFPNSMVFVQNPDYSAVYSLFKSVLQLSNIDLAQLESIITIDRIGLIAVSSLYERWVLLQIIKVLTNEFHFKMEDGWQKKLIASVSSSKYDIEFPIYCPEYQLELYLYYDCKGKLKNNKRPDFIIDIFHKDSSSKWIFDRLVMDAKFYDDHTEEHMNKKVEELAQGKDYSEGGKNRVFIIHPAPNLIAEKNISSPLAWNRSCNYGHVPGNNHKKGHIFLVPSKQYWRSIDNLKRLLLMHMQSVSTISHPEEIKADDPPSWHNLFCPGCGAGNESLHVRCAKTKSGKNKWIAQCEKCHQMSYENFCYSCHARLFKNGFYWTYHKTYAEQITNCICSTCGADLKDLNL